MKLTVYIEKRDFDNFFVWMNRLGQGALQPSPVPFSHKKEDIQDPLQISLNPDEYNLIQDAESNIEAIRNTWGNLDILYSPESLENQKIMMGDIIRNASRYDLTVDVVNTAIELAMQIPGITPLEALIIAERDWINAGKISHA
jgi:hypothetical protein